MKKLNICNDFILIVGLFILIINQFFLPMPDWVIRGTGIILIISVAVLIFQLRKAHK